MGTSEAKRKDRSRRHLVGGVVSGAGDCVVVIVVGSMMNTSRNISKRVSIVGIVIIMISWRTILPLRSGAILTRGTRGGHTSPISTHSHPIHSIIFLGCVHQVTKELVIREMCFINKPLEIKRDLLGGQFGQFSVRMFGKMFNPQWIAHVVTGAVVVVVVSGGGVVIVASVHRAVAQVRHLLHLRLLLISGIFCGV